MKSYSESLSPVMLTTHELLLLQTVEVPNQSQTTISNSSDILNTTEFI